MKKNLVYGIVFIALCGIAWFLVQKNSRSGMKIDRKMFQVADTASINRLFLADRTGKMVDLVREKNYWRLNKSYRVRPDAVNAVLQALGSMEVFSPVPTSGTESIMKQLAASGKKLEVYQKGVKVKTIYIGGPTSNTEGTYMLLEGEDLPMIVNVPGWQGYLTPRFFTNKEDWRENIFASFLPSDISNLSIEHLTEPERGYKIDASDLNAIKIFDQKGKPFASTQKALQDYLKRFKEIRADAFEYNTTTRDSVIKLPLLHKLTLNQKNGKPFEINFYRVKYKGTPTDKVDDLEYTDPNRAWFYVPSTKDFGSYQYGSTGNILLPINLFTKPTQ